MSRHDDGGYRSAAQELYQRHERRQLARISTGGSVYLHDRVDAQAQLAHRIGTALVEMGFTLYDRVAEDPLGGAMIMPREHPDGGVYVGRTIPDVLSHDDTRPARRALVTSTMNRAVYKLLAAYGFDIGEHPDHSMLITLGPDPERALEEKLDEFSEHVVGLCRQQLPHSDIPTDWPVANQIAVALVLRRPWHIEEHLGSTPRAAARRLFAEQATARADVVAWVRSLRAVLGLPNVVANRSDHDIATDPPLNILRNQAEGLVDRDPSDAEFAIVWADQDFAAATEVFGWQDPEVRDRFRVLLSRATNHSGPGAGREQP